MTPLDADLVAGAVGTCVPEGSTVTVVSGSSDALAAALAARSCLIVEGASRADAHVALLAAPEPELAALVEAAAAAVRQVRPDGWVIAVHPVADHVSARLHLSTDGAVLTAAAGLPADARAELRLAGLQLWGLVPVRADLLAGSGVDAGAVSPEVLDVVDEDPTAGIAAVVVIAGRAAPSIPEEAVTSLADELDRAWAAFLAERRRAASTGDARLLDLRSQLDDLGRQLDASRAELDEAHRAANHDAERIAALEERWQDVQRGFARLGLALDRRMLAHPRLRRLHASLGRLRRR